LKSMGVAGVAEKPKSRGRSRSQGWIVKTIDGVTFTNSPEVEALIIQGSELGDHIRLISSRHLRLPKTARGFSHERWLLLDILRPFLRPEYWRDVYSARENWRLELSEKFWMLWREALKRGVRPVEVKPEGA